MATFPPPTATNPRPRNQGLSPERAARLEQLATRNRPARADDIDADRAARLERLAGRTKSAPAGTATTPNRPPSASGSPGRARRNHPAKGARAAALGLSLASTGGLAALFAASNGASASSAAQSAAVILPARTATVASQTASTATSTTQSTAAPPTIATTQPVAPVSQAAVTTGPPPTAVTVTVPPAPTVVDGAVFHNRWGDVQVEVTFAADGSLTDVVALRTPNDRGQSIEINDYAVPRLTNEALSSQTAAVNTISGATYTSDSYRQSLQSAIDAARAAGITAIA
jgi:uncharacterized protein with FMN-binding domain